MIFRNRQPPFWPPELRTLRFVQAFTGMPLLLSSVLQDHSFLFFPSGYWNWKLETMSWFDASNKLGKWVPFPTFSKEWPIRIGDPAVMLNFHWPLLWVVRSFVRVFVSEAFTDWESALHSESAPASNRQEIQHCEEQPAREWIGRFRLS